MRSSIVQAAALMQHPDGCSDAVRAVGVRVRREAAGMLAITYSIEGDLARVQVPRPRPPQFADGLWKHTCCECFIALEDRTEYHELNFSPSGEWAAYAFTKYRDGTPLTDDVLDPKIAVRKSAAALDVTVAIPLDRLSSEHLRATLALGIAAVIEENEGVLSYWALRHPAGKPDFHQRDSFVLEVE
jgi:hypothetical protein